ncbi:O-antigen ligase family protein [Synergistaceae bacterium OttesenSCG-928-D05]|nr:O-antigen ligase family protein [Synergistaceae bacterium OttesenSCG-928-D05]
MDVSKEPQKQKRLEINSFQIGLNLWIFALCFSYFGDDVRRIISGIALLFLFKSKTSFDFSAFFQKNLKYITMLFIIFWCWITFAPLFSAGGVHLGIRSLSDPLEVIAYICFTLIFAKNEKFYSQLSKFMLCGGFTFFTILLFNRYQLDFAWNPNSWILSRTAGHAGAYVCFFVPWILGRVIYMEKSYSRLFICTFLFFEAVVLLVLTFYSTFWVAFFAQMFMTALVLFLKPQKQRLRNYAFFLGIALCLIIASGVILNHLTDGAIMLRMGGEFSQIMSVGSDFEKFTTHRSVIWKNTIDLIKQHPVFGWSWKNFFEVNVANFEGQIPDSVLWASVTPHSSYLSAAWCTGIPGLLLYLSVLALLFYKSFLCVRKGCREEFFFAVFILLVGYCVAGLAEDLFAWELRLMVPAWCIFAVALLRADEGHAPLKVENAGEIFDSLAEGSSSHV